jgi:hypothetical protein
MSYVHARPSSLRKAIEFREALWFKKASGNEVMAEDDPESETGRYAYRSPSHHSTPEH